MEESPSSQKTDSFCKVCGDKASGKHYGVPSCDGCRGFFKRSIRRNLEYVCKENGRCVVDVTRRNQCQACRFKKCLQVNMKRDAVQHERAPRSPQHAPLPPYTLGGRLRPFSFSALAAGVSTLGAPFHLQGAALDPTLSASPFLHQGLYAGAFGKHGLQSGLNLTANPYNIQKPLSSFLSPTLSSRTRIKEDEVSSSEEVAQNKSHEEDNPAEESHSRLELPIINDTCKASIRHLEVPCLNLFPAENIYETAAKLLFLAIKWARTIPSFLQLSYRDQSILLEESWSELFVLTAAQWAFTVDEAVLMGNVVVPSSRHSVLEEEARKLKEIITRLNLLRVDHTEHACLKALVLFKAESRGLCEPSHVELLQDQTHVMLHEYCAYRHTPHHHPHYKGRFGKLLLTLPAVQAVNRRGLEELLFRQTVGDVSIDRLLGELAQAAHP